MGVLRLYDHPASSNCMKVRILLGHLGIPYEKVFVDIFAGEGTKPDHLARNAAGRTPVLELESGDFLAESHAILLYLAEGTPYLPDDRLERAHVWQWLFFEQNLLEPSIGTGRFWINTGRAEGMPDALAQKQAAGAQALDSLERRLAENDFLVGGRYTIADIALYAYTHVADEAGIDSSGRPGIQAWIERVESQPGFVNDLGPYPDKAAPGRSDSVHG
jgi:glutathione S-transferase